MRRGSRGRRFAKKLRKEARRVLVRTAGSSWRWSDWMFFSLVRHDANIAARRGAKIPRSLRRFVDLDTVAKDLTRG